MTPPAKTERPFLTAEWRDLVMLNYELDPAIVRPYLPRGTEIDTFQGRTFVSLVGFRFLKTRIYGSVPIPFHSNFDEVNLRFYVRRNEGGELRRGVVFVAEIVPRRAIAIVARLAYNENYFSYPMTRNISRTSDAGELRYAWTAKQIPYAIEARTTGVPSLPKSASEEEFITEHYWGYARQRDGSTVEYRVEHEPWRVWKATSARFSGDPAALYGLEFNSRLNAKPYSAFVADGSPVKLLRGRKRAL
jgi:uncharacterized protein